MCLCVRLFRHQNLCCDCVALQTFDNDDKFLQVKWHFAQHILFDALFSRRAQNNLRADDRIILWSKEKADELTPLHQLFASPELPRRKHPVQDKVAAAQETTQQRVCLH